MKMTPDHYMRSAFLLAQKADPKQIRPNPFVGAILVGSDGEIIGKGYHTKAGEGHAEVQAIKSALEKTNDLTDCTLYVTLEPCSHHGKTPPCTDLIIQHKIPRVVIGCMDPNPLVSGVSRLEAAGVEVERLILPEIIEMNSVFNINQILKRPKYILKSALTKNGKIADQHGNSKWISNEKSRGYVHRVLRNHVDAILTTAKTVIRDNANMNIRIEGEEPHELDAVVIDRKLDLLSSGNSELNIFYPRKKSKVYLVSDHDADEKLRDDIEIIQVSFINGKCDLNKLSEQLIARNICEVLVEAGSILNTYLMEAELIDEIYLFISTSIVMDGNAIGIFNGNDLDHMLKKFRFELSGTDHFDDDILERYVMTRNTLNIGS
jgi:diaminohydroxyphosphoribosylaminopyrimidine deaminase/5-amino-6-(5-phosphoribosylamino)uracil reductase